MFTDALKFRTGRKVQTQIHVVMTIRQTDIFFVNLYFRLRGSI